MNWEIFIGFLGVAVIVVGAAVGLAVKQAVGDAVLGERLKATNARVDEMKAEHIRSASEQGTRIGDNETNIGSLQKFQARMEGAADKERDMSGVVRTRT